MTTTTKWPHYHFVPQPGENAGLRLSLDVGPARGAWRDGQMLYGNLRGEQKFKTNNKKE